MTDPTQTPDQPAVETPAAPGQQVDWQARYNGQQSKLQQQAATIDALTKQIGDLQRQVGDLSAQLGVKDVTRTQEVGQRDSTITTLQQENQVLKSQVATLQGLQVKLDTIKKLNRPELIQIMDAIPASDDAAKLEQAFAALAGFTDTMVANRERQLIAGVTPTGGNSPLPTRPAPTSTNGWMEYLNGLTFGSPEREKAMNDWYAWARANPNA